MATFTEFGINNTANFNNAIAQINAATSGTFVIDFLNNITLNAQLAPIVAAPGVTITINGSGATLSGNDTFRGLFVYSGAVTIENLEISHAVAKGGDGMDGGGGAAGLGGGLFVADDVAHGAAAPGNVTLVNVGFDNDKAIGGNGAVFDSNGPVPILNISGHTIVAADGGGGGMGGSATPGSVADFFGEVPGNGGPGIGPNGFGVGGTPGGAPAGFGGGGYGASLASAEDGGYGGGGGGGEPSTDPAVAALNAHGGFGAGDGNASGGGGLGAGGDIFVQQGAGLTIVGGTMAEGGAIGGLFGGSGLGTAIFMQGNGAIHLGTGSVAGQVTTIDGQIEDEGGTPFLPGNPGGEVTVFIEGAGTVVLSNPNFFFGSYAGATVLNNQATSGTLDVTTSGAAGGGVLFEGPATLRIENEVFQDGDNTTRGQFVSPIIGFGYADVIDLPGLAFTAGAQTQYNASTHALIVSSGGTSLTLDDVFAPALRSFSAISDGNGGTEVVEALNAGAPSGTSATMVMRNSSTGQFEIYDVGHNAVLGAATLGFVELQSTQSQWQVAGLGSFNGGDAADLLLRNTTTGAFEVYDVNNNNFTSGFSMGQTGTDWSVLGFGDFSGGAGETDMLMRQNGTAELEVYDISNNQITNAAAMGAVGPEWQFLGVGDFSSNSNETDLLMRDVNNGALEVYNINHNSIVGATGMGAIGLEWQFVGVGDFSGNAGETDMLMRDVNNGALEVYNVHNDQIVSAQAMGAVGLEWSLVGIGDFSGNPGETDMIMRDVNNGAFEIYDINQDSVVSASSIGAVGTDWQTVGIAADQSAAAAIASSGSATSPPELTSPAAPLMTDQLFGGAGGAAQVTAPSLAGDNATPMLAGSLLHG